MPIVEKRELPVPEARSFSLSCSVHFLDLPCYRVSASQLCRFIFLDVPMLPWPETDP